MISLPKLKKDMEFMRDMEEIIDIFKMAALIQFRLFQTKEETNDAFPEALEASLQLLSTRKFSSPYVVGVGPRAYPDGQPQGVAPTKAIVLVTSDEGFLGGLNMSIVETGIQRSTSQNDEIIVLGSQGARYLHGKRVRVVSLPGVDDDISPHRIQKLCDHLLKGYPRRFGQILVVYPEFISLTAQRPGVVELLPYKISPVGAARRVAPGGAEGFLVEPNAESIAKIFTELWMGHKILEIFRSSKQSEYAARIMHLEGSLQEISHLRDKVSSAYFRRIHALQDKTIREISASKILLKRRRFVA